MRRPLADRTQMETMTTDEIVEGDGPGHILSIDCPCFPRVEIVTDDDGAAHEHVIHNAWEDRYR